MKKLILILGIFLFITHCTNRSVENAENTNTDKIKKNTPSTAEYRKRIAVLDSGIAAWQIKEKYMCKDIPVFYTIGNGTDRIGHGTNVVGLIGERIDTDKYCITMYSLRHGMPITEIVFFLKKALNEHDAVGVNLSLASEGYYRDEELALKNLTDKGVRVFIASGNKKINLNSNCNIYPACYKTKNSKLRVIGSTDRDYSNYGKIVDKYVDGTDKGYPALSGTSMSTAIATGLYFSK